MKFVKTAIVSLASLTFAGTALADPITEADLGAISGPTTITGELDPREIHWFSFVVNGLTFLDITTNFSTFDTEIGVYDAAGNRVANDDDDGFLLASTLSFGTGSGLLLGDPWNLGGNGLAEGENGNLANGLYYLALGEYQTRFYADDFDVRSTGYDRGGRYRITFITAQVSESSTLALIGLGLIGLGLARRKKRPGK